MIFLVFLFVCNSSVAEWLLVSVLDSGAERPAVNRGTIGVNSLPKHVTRQRRGCDLNPGPSA